MLGELMNTIGVVIKWAIAIPLGVLIAGAIQLLVYVGIFELLRKIFED